MYVRPAKPARPAPPPIARAATAVISALAKATRYVDPFLVGRWREIVGEDVAALCRPGRITGARRSRTLELRAPSGSAAAKIQMLSGAIIERVNAYLGPEAVSRIAIRQASGPDPGPDDAPPGGSLQTALAAFRAAVKDRNRRE